MNNPLKDATRPQKLMLGAIVLMALSQFLPYSTAFSSAIFDGTATTHAVNEGVTGRGWEIHPHAIPVYVLLLGYFLSPLAHDKGFGRFGWWVAAIALFVTMMPGSPTPGVWVGLVAVGLAVVAAILNGRDVAKQAAEPPAG